MSTQPPPRASEYEPVTQFPTDPTQHYPYIDSPDGQLWAGHKAIVYGVSPPGTASSADFPDSLAKKEQQHQHPSHSGSNPRSPEWATRVDDEVCNDSALVPAHDKAPGGHQSSSRLTHDQTSPRGGPDRSVVSSTRPTSLWQLWMTEVWAIVFSIACLIVLSVVLRAFDGQRLPKWPLDINLNTVVAVLTTLAHAGFIAPVASCLSQGMWSWFRKERPLRDLRAFDKASRGVRGSFAMLWHPRYYRTFVIVGAILTVIGGLTTPITQQMVNYEPRNLTAGLGSVPAIRQFGQDALWWTEAAFNHAQLNPTMKPVSPIPPTCDTADCDFPVFHSLGVCAKVANVTSSLRIEVVTGTDISDDEDVIEGDETYKSAAVKTTSVSLGDGILTFAHQADVMMRSSMIWHKTVAFKDDAHLALSKLWSIALVFAVPAANNSTDIVHRAVEVALHLCVETHEASLVGGIPHTRVVRSTYAPANASAALAEPREYYRQRCEETTTAGNYHAKSFCRLMWIDMLFHQGGIYLSPSSKQNSSHAGGERSNTAAAAARVGAAADDDNGDHQWVAQTANWTMFGADVRTLNSLAYGFNTSVPCDRWIQYWWVETFDQAYNESWWWKSRGAQGPYALLRNTFESSYGWDEEGWFGNLEIAYRNVARGISDGLRTKPHANKAALDPHDVVGRAWVTETRVRISWGWLAFMASEVLVAALLLAATMAVSARHRHRDGGGGVMATRDPTLALVVALSDEARTAAVAVANGKIASESAARNLRVRLQGRELVPVDDGGSTDDTHTSDGTTAARGKEGSSSSSWRLKWRRGRRRPAQVAAGVGLVVGGGSNW